MRVATVALTLCLAVGPALAQAPKAAPLGGPPAAAAPKKTSDPGASLSTNARALLQFDLAWTGDYNGLITGAPGERTTAAVKSFQKSHGLKETGNLAPPERAQLAAASKQKQEEVGWRMVDDRATGARIGLATKQVPLTGEGKTGTRWFSAQRQVQIETFRIREPGTTLAARSSSMC
jgi:peptidoglycan hydrolase-like protein with peptidoglycan-binding domain